LERNLEWMRSRTRRKFLEVRDGKLGVGNSRHSGCGATAEDAKRPGASPRPQDAAASRGHNTLSGGSIQNLVVQDVNDLLALAFMNGPGDLDLFIEELL
jgi:hypothetical protein